MQHMGRTAARHTLGTVSGTALTEHFCASAMHQVRRTFLGPLGAGRGLGDFAPPHRRAAAVQERDHCTTHAPGHAYTVPYMSSFGRLPGRSADNNSRNRSLRRWFSLATLLRLYQAASTWYLGAKIWRDRLYACTRPCSFPAQRLQQHTDSGTHLGRMLTLVGISLLCNAGHL